VVTDSDTTAGGRIRLAVVCSCSMVAELRVVPSLLLAMMILDSHGLSYCWLSGRMWGDPRGRKVANLV
jgi:hypothetical protein